METTRIKLSELKLDLNNLRQHNEQQIELLTRSLTIFGQFKPIIVDKNTMTVKIGNGRVMAMRKLGWTDCDCILLDFSDKQGLEVMDNRLNELSSWQDKDLKKWWKTKGTEWWGIDKMIQSKVNKAVQSKEKTQEKIAPRQENQILCPKCGKPLVKKKRLMLD